VVETEENSDQNEERSTEITVLNNISNAPILHSLQRVNVQKQWKSLKFFWDFNTSCKHCDYVHLNSSSKAQRSKCCLNGRALEEPFPQLKELPPWMLHYATNRIQHMGRNSVSYNSVLCCAATGVENNEGGGFETIHGDHAVRLHGRTYHFLTTSTGNAGLNFFTFDNLAKCTAYATTTLNNAERGYQRIIPAFLTNIFQELKTYNSICQECEQIGHFAQDYMHSNTTVNALATINVATSYLDVAQITSDNATGNRIITFQRKGQRYANSIDCTDSMWEPFIYPLLFFHAERGWGADIRHTLRYTDYLIARLLCPEKINKDGRKVTLRVPNQSFDKFLRPIVRQLTLPDAYNSQEDDAYKYYTDVFGRELCASSDYCQIIRATLKLFCTELRNITQINGFDEFCAHMLYKLQTDPMEQIAQYIKSYIQSRRENDEPEEEIETALEEIASFHIGQNQEKGRILLIPTNRFQLMSRLSQTYLVDSISRAIDYRLRFHR